MGGGGRFSKASVLKNSVFRIQTGREDYREKGKIVSVDEEEVFGAWEEGSSCDRWTLLSCL